MYKFFSALIFLFAFGNVTAQLAAGTSPLDWAKKKCTDLGFKAGTERFGNCVLQLSRDIKPTNPLLPLPQAANTPSESRVQLGAQPGATFRDCDVCPEMVMIPGGKFLMGSKDDPFADPPPSKDEMPQHEVSIKSFSIGKFEVTQEQWYELMGTLPSNFKGRSLPVERISWVEAQEFVKKLSEKTGKSYRLPSEAEWEYAARAGSQAAYSFGDNKSELSLFGWFSSNANYQTHPVGKKSPNTFGLFDMNGNVWEWVHDCYNSNYVGAPADGSAWVVESCPKRVLRGGSWQSFSQYLRSADRHNETATNRYQDFGFRVARDN
jgi:formylglycine-generating enzyme required for sulfatase activity